MSVTRIEMALDMDLPVAVLFSQTPQTGDGWERLSNHSCGGFSCNEINGWAYLLDLRDPMPSFVRAVTDEEFCNNSANPNMDYWGSREHYQEQQVAYRAFLGRHGLFLSDDLLERLQQAAYPLDASTDNLRALVGDNSIPTLPDGVIVLFLGHNCD